MKKSAIYLTLLLILFSISLTLAENHTAIEKAFECLEEKAKDCSSLTTQEIALTIMATPDNIFNDCVAELEGRENSNNNWDNILDTSLAIMALNHAGKDTTDNEEWLMQQSQTPTDLIWYLQQDSTKEVECNIGYDANSYLVNISENKKIDKNAGPCLTRAQSNFWLQIANNCYDKTFQIKCDQDFIANLIYKNKNSETIYVLEGTSSAPAFKSIELSVNSKCFGGTSCNYEATAWAARALLQTNNNIDEYIPYIIAMSETNQRYLPAAFSYMLTGFPDYANALILEQDRLKNYWEAKLSSHNKYYDTGLALLALTGSTAEPVLNSKDWLLNFSQKANGCWQNSVRDTAMILWALEGRADKIGPSSTPTPTVSFSASPGSIAPGNASTLAWSSTNAASCIGTNFSTGGAISGSLSVTPSINTTYSIGCTGTGGSANTTVTVYVIIGSNSNTSTTNESTPGPTSSITYCKAAGNFCIQKSECIQGEDVSDSYFCSGSATRACCTEENLKTCEANRGEICASSEICIGDSTQATDTNACCTGTCEDRPQENSCEANFYTCSDTCSESQEPISAYSCDRGQSCCKSSTTTSSEESGSLWWIWVLVILILITLGAIIYVYREQLKLYLFQLKTKFKKDDGKGASPRGRGIPPRPGFPPTRRGPPSRRPMPSRQAVAPRTSSPQEKDKAMSDTFKKLQDMSR